VLVEPRPRGHISADLYTGRNRGKVWEQSGGFVEASRKRQYRTRQVTLLKVYLGFEARQGKKENS